MGISAGLAHIDAWPNVMSRLTPKQCGVHVCEDIFNLDSDRSPIRLPKTAHIPTKYLKFHLIWFWFWLCLTPLSAIFQLIIMATSFSGGRSRSTWKEPLTMGKQLVSFITCSCESSAPFFVIYKAGCEPTPYWWWACMSCLKGNPNS